MKTISITIIITLLSFCLVQASDYDVDNEIASRLNLIMPEAVRPYQEAVEEEVALKKLIELFNRDIDLLKYNENGTIDTVLYKDGLKVAYSYEYDENRELKACILDSEDVKIVFTKEKMEDYIDRKKDYVDEKKDCLDRKEEILIAEIYMKNNKSISNDKDAESTSSSETQNTREISSLNSLNNQNAEPDPSLETQDSEKTGPIVIYYPEMDLSLEDIATTPIKFDFKEIKETIIKVRQEKEEAYQEYMRNTESYYEKIQEELKTKFNLLKSEGISLSAHFKSLGDKNIIEEEKRELIDDAVEYIRSETGKEEVESITAQEFLVLEEHYRIEFLDSNKEIYDKRIEKALEYIRAIIDKLLSSRLAFYLNLKQDKIDVIINLPKPEEESKEE